MLRGVMRLTRGVVRPGGITPWVALWTGLFVLVNRAPILGRGMPIWDARDSFFPFYVLTADHARAGRIVSWDVWSNAGLPRLGDPEFGAVWPLQLLVGLVFGGTPTGFIAYWMIVWWLGGLGMFLLARQFSGSSGSPTGLTFTSDQPKPLAPNGQGGASLYSTEKTFVPAVFLSRTFSPS